MARRPKAPADQQPNPEDDGREPEERPFSAYPKNGLLCAECHKPQHETPSGPTCGEHGGADGYEPPPAKKPLAEATSTPETRRAVRGEKIDAATGVGPNVFPTGDEGELVTATAAECLFSPKQYNAFRIGPFTVQTRVRPGETHLDALRRAQKACDALYTEAFDKKLAQYVGELRKAEGAAR